MPQVRRLVYVSCNVESLMENAAELCTPVSSRGDGGGGAPAAFKPVRAVAHDLFPHTTHCETGMLFERDCEELLGADEADKLMGDGDGDGMTASAGADADKRAAARSDGGAGTAAAVSALSTEGKGAGD